jgi:chromosome partitioning protein
MKTLVMVNQKGGVGKSAITAQLAYYFTDILNKRVLVIDLDHQSNSTKTLKLSERPTLSTVLASQLLTDKISGIEADSFVVVGGDKGLITIEKQGDTQHRIFAGNFRHFLASVADAFDVCIIDTNPNPDIRQLAALISADYLLSPIQLNQEAIDGIGGLLNHERMGVRKIQAALNPKLQFMGVLPNQVEPTPFQRENLKVLAGAYGKMMMLIPEKGFAAIKKTTAIPESIAAGAPIWKLGKSSSREAWANIKPVFETIAARMEIQQ